MIISVMRIPLYSRYREARSEMSDIRSRTESQGGMSNRSERKLRKLQGVCRRNFLGMCGVGAGGIALLAWGGYELADALYESPEEMVAQLQREQLEDLSQEEFHERMSQIVAKIAEEVHCFALGQVEAKRRAYAFRRFSNQSPEKVRLHHASMGGFQAATDHEDNIVYIDPVVINKENDVFGRGLVGALGNEMVHIIEDPINSQEDLDDYMRVRNLLFNPNTPPDDADNILPQAAEIMRRNIEQDLISSIVHQLYLRSGEGESIRNAFHDVSVPGRKISHADLLQMTTKVAEEQALLFFPPRQHCTPHQLGCQVRLAERIGTYFSSNAFNVELQRRLLHYQLVDRTGGKIDFR